MPSESGWKISLEYGIAMRGATRSDADALAAFNGEMHREPNDPPGPNEWIVGWTRDLITKPHPSMSLDDVIIVEDQATGQIVSSCVYFQQTWSYRGIAVPFGRPELVSTHPDYRNRGLIRRQFELMHRWADERGHLVLGITGIPNYYRQFGYEMALGMGVSRSTTVSQLPRWKTDEERSVRLRPAVRADVGAMVEFRKNANTRSLFSPEIDAAELEYQRFDRHETRPETKSTWIIETAARDAIGFVALQPSLMSERVGASVIEFSEPAMFRLHTQSLLKCLREVFEEWPVTDDNKRFNQVNFDFLGDHPASAFLGRDVRRRSGRPYAWYIRVPNLPKLLLEIAPVLERRLVGTVFEGLTATKILSFYRSGVRIEFKNGKLVDVGDVKFPERHETAAHFPEDSFLQLLFGRRNLNELNTVLVDAFAESDENELLIDTLFPKMTSDTWLATS